MSEPEPSVDLTRDNFLEPPTMRQVNFRIAEPELELIDNHARAWGISRSEWIRLQATTAAGEWVNRRRRQKASWFVDLWQRSFAWIDPNVGFGEEVEEPRPLPPFAEIMRDLGYVRVHTGYWKQRAALSWVWVENDLSEGGDHA